MRISGKAELADVDDARKLILGKFYRFRYLASATVIGPLLVWACLSVRGLLPLDWVLVGAVPLAMLFSIVRFLFDRFERKKHLKWLNATLPDWISILPDGVRLEHASGVVVFLPWSYYRTYQEGARLIWIKPPTKDEGIMLPISSLSEIDKQALRRHLAAALP